MSNIDKYETRKKMVYDFMCDDMYVPMKIKELCIVLGVKKEDRPQLEQILLDLQVEVYLRDVVNPVLEAHKDESGVKAEINV